MSVRFGFEAADLIAEGRITRDEINEMRNKLADAKVPSLNDEQIALFILSCDHDLDFTLVTIKEYFKARKNGPELFDNRCLERPDLTRQLDIIEYNLFPTRTPDGCIVMFHRLHDTYYSNYVMEDSMKLLMMTLDAAVYDNPPTGLIMLFDMKGVGLRHLTRIKLSAVRTFAHYLQEGLPIKLKDIHIMNTAYFIDKVMFIIKPFIKPALLNQLHFHPPDVNMEMFYETYLPKKCLPKDFGGDLPEVRVLHEENTKKLAELRPYFDAEEKQRKDYYKK